MMPYFLTPQPVACTNCQLQGLITMLKASYAAENDGCCPGCQEPACYTCGCSEHTACTRESRSLDGKRSVTLYCSWVTPDSEWYAPGLCSFCFYEASYVLYMEVTGRVPTDPFYLRTYVPGETHRLNMSSLLY